MKTRSLLLVAAAALALGGLSGCATSFKADVARFQQLPPAQGQSFTIQPGDPQLAGSLEFAHYAELLAQRLVAQGYTRATDPAAAQLVVNLDYGIDNGTQRVRYSGFASPYYSDPFFYPGYYRGWYGWRGRYAMGWYDPFMWGGGYNDVDTYIVYQSQLRMSINYTGGARLFEGTAKAQSVSSKLSYLIPNLIDALFTGFPGQNGEEIRVTIAPEPKTKN